MYTARVQHQLSNHLQANNLVPTNYTIDLTGEPPGSSIITALCNALGTLPAGHGITIGTQSSVNFYLQVRKLLKNDQTAIARSQVPKSFALGVEGVSIHFVWNVNFRYRTRPFHEILRVIKACTEKITQITCAELGTGLCSFHKVMT